ncbi:MAG: hypothetical protein RSC91_09035, partial [Clostridia bacterium]
MRKVAFLDRLFLICLRSYQNTLTFFCLILAHGRSMCQHGLLEHFALGSSQMSDTLLRLLQT